MDVVAVDCVVVGWEGVRRSGRPGAEAAPRVRVVGFEEWVVRFVVLEGWERGGTTRRDCDGGC